MSGVTYTNSTRPKDILLEQWKPYPVYGMDIYNDYSTLIGEATFESFKSKNRNINLATFCSNETENECSSKIISFIETDLASIPVTPGSLYKAYVNISTPSDIEEFEEGFTWSGESLSTLTVLENSNITTLQEDIANLINSYAITTPFFNVGISYAVSNSPFVLEDFTIFYAIVAGDVILPAFQTITQMFGNTIYINPVTGAISSYDKSTDAIYDLLLDVSIKQNLMEDILNIVRNSTDAIYSNVYKLGDIMLISTLQTVNAYGNQVQWYYRLACNVNKALEAIQSIGGSSSTSFPACELIQQIYPNPPDIQDIQDILEQFKA